MAFARAYARSGSDLSGRQDRRIRLSSSSEETPLNWNKLARQVHRWMSIAFTAAVIVNIVNVVVTRQREPVLWMGLLAAVPFVLLVLTGLYLFVLPYVAKARSGRRARG